MRDTENISKKNVSQIVWMRQIKRSSRVFTASPNSNFAASLLRT